jgi:hypothetical protein
MDSLCNSGIQRYLMLCKQSELIKRHPGLIALSEVAKVENGGSIPTSKKDAKLVRGINCSAAFNGEITDKTRLPELLFSYIKPVCIKDGCILISGFSYNVEDVGRACLAKRSDKIYVSNALHLISLDTGNEGYLRQLYEYLSRPETYLEQLVFFDDHYVNLTVGQLKGLLVPKQN